MADPWGRIASWCVKHAPDTAVAIRARAPTEVLGWAQRSSGSVPWPEPVSAFYVWCDGTERTPAGYLWPGYRPLPLLEVVETWRELMRACFPDTAPPPDNPEDDLPRAFAQQANDLFSADAELAALMRNGAGRACGRFLPGMLPIAEDQSGGFLMCDRRGRTHDGDGAIAVWDRDEGYTHDAPRGGLKDVATATARALPTGCAVAGTRVCPVAPSERLSWCRPAPDPLDEPDGTTVDLPAGNTGWSPLPGTDLEVQATASVDGTRLRYRRQHGG